MSNDNDTPRTPIAAALKARLVPFLTALTKELGGDEVALAAAIAKLEDDRDLVPVYNALITAPIFRRHIQTDDGKAIPVIALGLTPQVMQLQGKNQVTLLIVDVIVADPGIGRQIFSRVVITTDDLHLVAPGTSLNDKDDSQSEYHSGAMGQLKNLSETVRAFMFHLLRSPAFAKGSAADKMRLEALNDLGYVDPMGYPISGKVMDNIEALFSIVDDAMGLKQGTGLEATLQARLRTLPAGKFLTGKDVAAIIEPLRKFGLRLAIRAKEGEVAGLGLELSLTDDAGRAISSILIGLGLDGDASLVAPEFSVHVHGSAAFVNGAALMALHGEREGLSAERRATMIDVILHMVQGFGAFTNGDAKAEAARRQIAQTLSIPGFDVLKPTDDDND
ncbi:MAG: hypothetical protein GC134_09585 [Proteobacteria bacterium]|nr:hypothetical protein [Pseudomonadota bacterium]